MDELVGELIFPSFFYPPSENHIVTTLVYMPSLNFCIFINNYSSSQIQILDLTSRSPVRNLAFEDRDYSRVIALSSDGRFLASDVEYDHPLPTQIRLSLLSSDGKDLKPDRCVNSRCIEPDLGSDKITSIKFSPDGKNIFVTTYQNRMRMRRGAWLTMYDVPDNFWSNETDKEQEIEESGTDDNKDGDNEAKNSDHEEPNVERYSQHGNSDKVENVEVGSEDMNAGKKSLDGKDEGETDEIRRGSESDISGEEQTVEEHKNNNASGQTLEDVQERTRRSESDESDEENSETRNNVTFDVYHLNVLEQGYSIPPSPPDSSSDSDREFHTLDEYYDWRYGTLVSRDVDETNLFRHNSGFYCLAISPDTTRLLAGNHDGEVFVIDQDSLNVLQHMQAHEKDTVVSGCHYNPVFAHDEFATCGGDKLSGGMLNIWRAEHLENDTEKASCVHSLSFESYPAKCCYSPDGKLVAVTCDSLFTYIVCSRSGVVLYTLNHVDEHPKPRPGISPYSFSVTLFAGRTCQVLTTPNYKNYSIAIWNLPVVYSLETLCLLVLRATIKYGNIDALCLPTSLKLRLKYLYV